MTQKTDLITNKVRVTFASLDAPHEPKDGGEAKYKIAMLLPKSDKAGYKAILEAMEAAKEKGKVAKWGGVIPKVLKLSVHDGDGERATDGEPFQEECHGHWVFTASSKNAPGVATTQGGRIVEADPTVVYSGCWVRAKLNFFPYASNSTKGIGIGLNQVLFWEDGEPLGGFDKDPVSAFSELLPEVSNRAEGAVGGADEENEW